jgi:UDP-glucose 4-epimerase
MRKKILITGGLGLIGSNLSIKLIKLGFDVSIIDNFSSGSIANIPTIYRKKIKIIRADILNEKILKKNIFLNDLIFHFAAYVGVKNILLNKVKSIETNTIGTEKVLRFSSIFKKKVVIASTSEVFGKNYKNSLDENDDFKLGNIQTFRWSYAAGKILDEYLAHSYMIEKKLKVLIVRFFNTVGPKQLSSYGMVIPRFVKSALKNENIIVYGSGNQTRAFLHVDDATDALIKLMKINYYKEVIHIGGTQNISILNLAKKIKKITKSNSRIIKVGYKFAYSKNKIFSNIYEDIIRRHPSIKKIKKLINFKPKFNLNKILKDIINFHKNK